MINIVMQHVQPEWEVGLFRTEGISHDESGAS